MSTIYSQTIVTREAQPFRQSTLSRAIQFCLATSWKLKKIICKSHGSQGKARQWIQTFFIFNLTWGDDPIWLIFFKWVETTNQVRSNKKFHLKAGRISGCLPSFRAEKWTHSVLDIFFLFFFWDVKNHPWIHGETPIHFEKNTCFQLGGQRNHQLAFFLNRMNPYTVHLALCFERTTLHVQLLPFRFSIGRLAVYMLATAAGVTWRLHAIVTSGKDPVTGLKHSTGWPPWYLERAC